MLRILQTVLMVLSISSPIQAALDPEIDKPYHLQLVLSFAERRVFTPVFRENVERELRDSLQTAFGAVVNVTAVREHPLLAEAWSKGLQKTLDGIRLVSDTKTHFVLIDHDKGHYEIQARQHDGSTGLASPEVRRARTADRLLVARAAALMVEQDFGAIGTLPPVAGKQEQGQSITVSVKGGQLGPGVERLVKKEEVFLVAQITQTAAGLRSVLVPGVVLQAAEEPRDGACVCWLYYRYVPALPAGTGVLGFRAVKVATTESRLRLRVVRNDDRREALTGLNVALSSGLAGPAETQSTSLGEPLLSRHTYRHLAFAQIYKGNVPLTGRFPVPVLGDVAQPCPVGVTPEAERRGAVETRLRNWGSRWYDAWLVYGSLVADFNKTSETAPETALKTSRQGLAQLGSDLVSLDGELGAIRAEAGKPELGLVTELAEGQQRLKELRSRYDTLVKSVDDLEKALAKQKDPRIKELQALLNRARVLESELEFDQALALYGKVLADAPAAAQGLHEHVKKLRDGWALKDEEHRDARAFVYETWSSLKEAARIKDRLPDAWRFFDVCRKAGDRLTLRKLLRVSKDFAARLAKEYEALRPDASDDDRKAAETIAETSTDLVKLIKAVSEEVEKSASP